MNQIELLSSLKSAGVIMLPPCEDRTVQLTQSALQQMRAAVLPTPFIELYKEAGGIMLGDALIFGPEKTERKNYEIPSIAEINREMSIIGKTIFGRNGLFLFAFDAFGRCEMLNNLNLQAVKKYDEPRKAMYDCLIVGKI